MKVSEIRERSNDDLEQLARDLTRKLWQTRFENQTNQLDDTSQIRKLRRDVARVKTVLTERHRQQAPQEQE
ncbi:MAG: 50S ribosomal protein L29 [Myxococcales bacterium]|nr:50S ribosomal protein L29 [Myxococcales bacterium]